MQLSEKQTKAIASFANVAGDKGDPFALQGVKLVVKDGVATIYATNRFILASQSFEVLEGEDVTVVLSPDVVKFLKTAKGVTELKVTEDSIEVSSGNQQFQSPIYKGAYPPIEELVVTDPVPVAQDKLFSLDMAQLLKISKIVSSLDDKNTKNAYQFFTQGFDDKKNSPKPLVLKRQNVVAIIQPMRVS